MTLSRTSRILIGFLLLALAAFLWVNFLVNGPGLDFALLRAAPSPFVSSADTASAEGAPDDGAAPGDAADGGAQAPAVAPIPGVQVARDLEILDLPFLVTEPPPEVEPEVEPEAEAPAQEPIQPETAARRATVNPFAPIIQTTAPAAPTPAPAQNEVVTTVPVPAGPSLRTTAPATPSVPAAAPRAPAPAPVTPAAQATGTLPRALPGGTLGSTPQLLRSAIGTRELPTVANLAQVVAVREPPAPEVERDSAAPVVEQSSPTTRSEPQPLPRPLVEGDDAVARGTRLAGEPPLAAGTSNLSRYLRDNDVRFTGSVIGPVSVGVFRSSQSMAPIVISLGQSLPDTAIVLTDLRGQQAELALGDATQTLTLELRR